MKEVDNSSPQGLERYLMLPNKVLIDRFQFRGFKYFLQSTRVTGKTEGLEVNYGSVTQCSINRDGDNTFTTLARILVLNSFILLVKQYTFEIYIYIFNQVSCLKKANHWFKWTTFVHIWPNHALKQHSIFRDIKEKVIFEMVKRVLFM